jgi:hypothetical protein
MKCRHMFKHNKATLAINLLIYNIDYEPYWLIASGNYTIIPHHHLFHTKVANFNHYYHFYIFSKLCIYISFLKIFPRCTHVYILNIHIYTK